MEDNKDQGLNVREKAKAMVALLKDDERLKNERTRALKAKERFAQSTQGKSDRALILFGSHFQLLQDIIRSTRDPLWDLLEMNTSSVSSLILSWLGEFQPGFLMRDLKIKTE